MKRLYKYSLGLVVVLSLSTTSCKKFLDEVNPGATTLETAYGNKSGFEGLINTIYVDNYFFYGKVDFIGPSEMGTDLWINYAGSDIGITTYDNTLTTGLGTLKTIWGGCYSAIGLANTAIEFSTKVKGYSSQTEIDTKVAEAYFWRAWAYFNLVEQFGPVYLTTKSAATEGNNIAPKRSTEKEIYDVIISDLKFATEKLPLTQGALRGRIAKKAAYALLAKVYLQRTRLGEAAQYGALALAAAEELINNQAKYNCALYTSDATRSGFAKAFDLKNNKSNTEFLFLQAIDVTGLNPEGFNRGRTRQYYLPDLGGRGADWGTIETTVLYGRSNAKQYKPTKYLLTSIFDPRETTPDTRFANTFTYKFYASADKVITAALATTYQKDASIVGKTILSTRQAYTGPDYFLAAGGTFEEEKNMTNDVGLSVFTPNWTIPTATKKAMPCLVADPSDLFDPATNNYKLPASFPNEPSLINIFPAFKKFSGKMYAQSNQNWLGDIPIIRLGEVYLIAAEAALLANNDALKASTYVNVIRKRAALTSRESEMLATPAEMNVAYILKERGRELAGEHTRWIDLKRTGNLSKTYFQQTNPAIAANFDPAKHTQRPIPQYFLDAITNAAEFGNNGY
ncbi:RagB/SusD family nutrient uptake outer membrane protein [Pedobacter frigiditerrae]|uniref:RagB/SusD family nutrient uptake outer membrane protein n=1 Tax=Pedobacter frigiditerrae TaxID=2530452 RepID=UPI002931996B|nr:RagB/SusD family nutrient uptake outer membrane protein [Pedobacter frigiditerrae]